MFLRAAFLLIASFSLLGGCGINSVTRAEIEAIKPGNRITYRYTRDGKSRFYADKVTRIEGDTIYFNTGKMESTSGTDARLDDYDTTRELSVKKADIAKYDSEQPPDGKKIIWIE
jgi:hypothetical protein